MLEDGCATAIEKPSTCHRRINDSMDSQQTYICSVYSNSANRELRGGHLPPKKKTGRRKKSTSQPIRLPVARQRWKKEGIDTIRLGVDASDINPDLPILFQDQQVSVQSVQGSILKLHDLVTCKADRPLTITQRIYTAQNDKMQALVAQSWGELWNREGPEDSRHCWPEAMNALSTLPDLGAFPATQFTVDRWDSMLRQVPGRSARGADSFTPYELKIMPASLKGWLFQLFETVECTGEWPQRLTDAKVVMLSKGDRPATSPMDCRPITILSRLYRCWAKLRSAEVVSHLVNAVEVGTAGAAAGVSADMVIARTLNMVEDASLCNQEIFGLVIDLVKCFNRIPRIPLLAAFLWMGVPVGYLRALEGMLDSLRRFTEISHQMGNAIPSTCGFPEGCAFSVAAMLMLSTWASSYLQFYHPSVEPNFFADNWGFVCDSAKVLKEATQRLALFTDFLAMEISPTKSWIWANTQKGRSAIRSVKLQGHNLQVNHRVTDMGCDVSYGKAKVKTQSKVRLQKAIRVLHRTHKKTIPKAFKTLMTNSLGHGIVAYGSALVSKTDAEWKSLRYSMIECLGRARSGSSPWLSACVCGRVTDPQLNDLFRKIKFWRSYFKFHPFDLSHFCQKLCSTNPRRVGPAAIFKFAFAQVGWSCHERARMVHNSGLSFDWFRDSMKHVRHILHASWSVEVAGRVAHRRCFDVESFDVGVFQACIKPLDPRSQGSAIALACGKNVTKSSLSKYCRTIDNDCCPLCGKVDTKEHRIFHCPGVQDLRDQHESLFRLLPDLPSAFWAFGVVPSDWAGWKLKDSWSKVWPTYALPSVGNMEDVFSDGSAFLQDVSEFTISAGAAILVRDNQAVILDAQLVPGADHSSYRGEVFSILLALQQVWSMHLHTDCSAVVTVFRAMMLAKQLGQNFTPCKHWDLWNPIWCHILQRPVGCLQVTKVAAHTQWNVHPDSVVRWKGRWNEEVDRIAKEVIRGQHKDKLAELTNLYNDRVRKQALMSEFLLFWVDANSRIMGTSKQDENPTVHTPDFQAFLCNGDGTFPFRDVDLNLCSEFPFGERFTGLFVDWCRNVKWLRPAGWKFTSLSL